MPLRDQREGREMMSFKDAAAAQYRYRTMYLVYLCGPNGEREIVGSTSRRSGRGLVEVLLRERVRERVNQIPGIFDATVKKTKCRLEFSNGWSLSFGRTMREEAAAAERNQEA